MFQQIRISDADYKWYDLITCLYSFSTSFGLWTNYLLRKVKIPDIFRSLEFNIGGKNKKQNLNIQ